eukprot:55385-Pyramimonas_sp.AAC.1
MARSGRTWAPGRDTTLAPQDGSGSRQLDAPLAHVVPHGFSKAYNQLQRPPHSPRSSNSAPEEAL